MSRLPPLYYGRLFDKAMLMMHLTGKQKRFLRGLGNAVKSTIMVGKAGVTDNTVLSVRQAFNTKELVKVKLQDGCPDSREEAAGKITDGTGASLVQILGHTLLFFKRDHQHPKIELPD